MVQRWVLPVNWVERLVVATIDYFSKAIILEEFDTPIVLLTTIILKRRVGVLSPSIIKAIVLAEQIIMLWVITTE